MGSFITFEGIEGCGKTTQAGLVAEFLRQRGEDVLTTEEPGGTPLGLRVRELLLNRGPYTIGPEAELLLFLAARAQHVREVILPALQEGRWVLCDRFADATMAYQGFGRGVPGALISGLNAFACQGREPDLTFLIDLPVEVGLRRALARIASRGGAQAEDRFEREALDFHHRVRQGYLSLAEGNPRRFRVIDGEGDVAAVQGEIGMHLSAFVRG